MEDTVDSVDSGIGYEISQTQISFNSNTPSAFNLFSFRLLFFLDFCRYSVDPHTAGPCLGVMFAQPVLASIALIVFLVWLLRLFVSCIVRFGLADNFQAGRACSRRWKWLCQRRFHRRRSRPPSLEGFPLHSVATCCSSPLAGPPALPKPPPPSKKRKMKPCSFVDPDSGEPCPSQARRGGSCSLHGGGPRCQKPGGCPNGALSGSEFCHRHSTQERQETNRKSSRA